MRLCTRADDLSQSCLNEHVLEFDYDYTKNLYTSAEMGSWREDATDYVGDLDVYGNRCTQCECLMSYPDDSNFGGVIDGSCCSGGGTCSPDASNTDRFMFPGNSILTVPMKYKLPAGVTSDHAVLQWMYVTGNSPDSYPEGFFNCADIKIVAAGGSSAPTPAPPPTAKPVNPFPTPAMPGRCCWWDRVRSAAEEAAARWGGMAAPFESEDCNACTSELEAACARSEADCDACGGQYCPYDPAWTESPTTSPADGDDCECRSVVGHISDEWCQAVECAAAYNDFCGFSCDDGPGPAPKPTPRPVADAATPTPRPVAPVPRPTFARDSDRWVRFGYVENWKMAGVNYDDYAGTTALLYSFLTLDQMPNPDSPRAIQWDGLAIYDSQTRQDVMAVMGTDSYTFERDRIIAMMDWCAANGKQFIWAFGGWSDLTKTIGDDQVESLVTMLVELIATHGGDGIDFDWEHLSQWKGVDDVLHAQQRGIVGKTIVALKTALVARGLGDKWLTYTPRYNAFWADGAHGSNEFATDGEGADVVDYVLKNYGPDAIDYVHLMMYDINAQEGFKDAPEPYFTVEHYDAVVDAFAGYLPLSKLVVGFEPGPQAYTGVWGGLDHDKATIAHLRAKDVGGVMFWAMNEAALAANGQTVGQNAVALADYAAGL